MTVVSRCARRIGFALVMVLATAGSARAAQSTVSFDPDNRTDVRVTEQDVAASNAKIDAAYGALVQMWSADFRVVGARFVAPALGRYRGRLTTSCGVMNSDNAFYCASANAIYFDEVFIAREAKSAALELGTDGDMVAVGIIAHEMGHAVTSQLGQSSRVPYENEATADCLAGAFAKHANEDGTLEEGDLQEAFYGMASAGDPAPQLTGNARRDARLIRQVSLNGHGTRDQRMANFKSGFEGGAGACLETFN